MLRSTFCRRMYRQCMAVQQMRPLRGFACVALFSERAHALLQGDCSLLQNLVACCTAHQDGMQKATIRPTLQICTSRL